MHDVDEPTAHEGPDGPEDTLDRDLPESSRRLINDHAHTYERQPKHQSFYDAVGGHETFVRLVDTFYREMGNDPVLRPMYPKHLEASAERLVMFLEQYWGGPATYAELRGQPRLLRRHAPFRVNADARDRWLAYMRVAVESLHLTPIHQVALWDYLERAAHSLMNVVDE